MAWAHLGEYLPPTGLFPKLDVKCIRTKISLLEELVESLEDSLQEQLSIQNALEGDFEIKALNACNGKDSSMEIKPQSAKAVGKWKE